MLENTALLQHHKVFVIDGAIAVAGSYNPTRAAHSTNNENIIIFHDEGIAAAYAEIIHKITQTFIY